MNEVKNRHSSWNTRRVLSRESFVLANGGSYLVVTNSVQEFPDFFSFVHVVPFI